MRSKPRHMEPGWRPGNVTREKRKNKKKTAVSTAATELKVYIQPGQRPSQQQLPQHRASIHKLSEHIMQSSRTYSSRWLRNALNVERSSAALQVPTFLCPAAALNVLRRPQPAQTRRSRPSLSRRLHIEHTPTPDHLVARGSRLRRELPVQCPGCGALTQTTQPGAVGFFDVNRRNVRAYLGLSGEHNPRRAEQEALEHALRSIDLTTVPPDVSSLLSGSSSQDG